MKCDICGKESSSGYKQYVLYYTNIEDDKFPKPKFYHEKCFNEHWDGP